MAHNWKEENNELIREFVFSDFNEAICFILRVAQLSESAAHHPKIENCYNRVVLRLTTHDAGNKVTEKDIAMAKQINGMALNNKKQ